MSTPPETEPNDTASGDLGSEPPRDLRTPLLAAAITTVVVTAASYLTPDKYAATIVGMAFLFATWWLVLRHDEISVRAHGLALGGLLEPTRIDPARMARATIDSVGWALLVALVSFPPFWFGYIVWRHPHGAFRFTWPTSALDEIAGQLLVIALPEEAFFRGYLQTSLTRAFRTRWRILGADLGPGWLLASAIFALGHVLTVREPARLAVFFPALVFGWLRQRTRGVGAAVLFHAACNLFSATLGRGYGLH